MNEFINGFLKSW